jgi:mycothiol S-conjugate amidase
MVSELCLLSVHAHPDDESSKGAATIAKYHAQGVRCILVCCTGGEEGEILNPALDSPEVLERLPEVRAEELARAAEIIGYDEVVMLGYRDSGMPGSEANERPESFARAPLDEATGRLVEVMRRERPQVMVIYPKDQWYYPHPDHLRAHDVGMAAFHAAADPSAFPEAGPPWQVQKVYYSMFSRRRMSAMATKFLELGIEVPWMSHEDDEQRELPPEDEVTTEVDVTGYSQVRDLALKAHATQVDPNSPFWFGLPEEAVADLGFIDEYHLAVNLTSSQPPEDDLFAGARENAVL